jgi:hypothetical protein
VNFYRKRNEHRTSEATEVKTDVGSALGDLIVNAMSPADEKQMPPAWQLYLPVSEAQREREFRASVHPEHPTVQ